MKLDGWLGLDIGGANIKIAFVPLHAALPSESNSIPFALWKNPEQLGSTLAELFAVYRHRQLGIAVTMTGELADGYPNRRAGVESIVDAVEFACAGRFPNDAATTSMRGEAVSQAQLVFYGLSQTSADSGVRSNCWHGAESAKAHWTSVAAANWHAIAACLDHLPNLKKPLNGFLVDIGSTTTDIVPIRNGLPAASGLNDLIRLQNGELFYAGVTRTPICSLVQDLRIGSCSVTIARELFATIEDAFLVSGDRVEDEKRSDTADGRPATRAHAMQRLAKMVCADAASENRAVSFGSSQPSGVLSTQELSSMAHQVISALCAGIMDSITRVVDRNHELPKRFFITGQGDWLAKRILAERFGSEADLHEIAEYVGTAESQAMAAFAVARLAATAFATLEPKTANPHVACSSSSVSTRVASSETEKPKHLRVIKVGGSLLDRPRSPERIRNWLKSQQECYWNIWVAGGGRIVDQIRDFDRNFQLADSTSHWLALDAMSLNLRLLCHWFPDWPVVDNWEAAKQQFQRSENGNALFDFGRWLKHRPPGSGQLPESWEITSDSCAAFLAQELGVAHLTLLKSCHIDSEQSLEELAESGIVDKRFPHLAMRIPHVQLVNLNSEA
jgi:(4-(4-[2-(gamma-L-glutamylamino)ethyl]phenoxymethyl)furan-2-yl)methanamine synthase